MKRLVGLSLMACLGLACGPVSGLLPATSSPTARAQATTQFTKAAPSQVSTAIPESDTATLPAVDTGTPSVTVPAAPAAESPTSTPSVDLPPSLSFLMGTGPLDQYMNPVGTPLQSWKDIPIMPQATDGQAYGDSVYSFKAKATLAQARSFYDKAHLSLAFGMTEPTTGTGGSGASATHSVTYVLPNGILDIESFDSNPSEVVVVIELQ